MNVWLAIFSGGAIGAVARFLASGWIYARFGTAFPWGTLAVNVIGSFALGIAIGWVRSDASPETAAFLVPGLLGSFTTFSTFAFEAYSLVEEKRTGSALLYVAGSVGAGLVSISLGLALSSLR